MATLQEIAREMAALTGEYRCPHASPPCADCVASEEQWLADVARDCRNCLQCNQQRPCGGCTAGGICDEWCDCDDGDPEERDCDPDEDRTP